MKIIIAEDDITYLNLLEKLLIRWGHETIGFSDGRGALEEIRKDDSPKLAILDWMMPFMDGVDICRQLRKTQKTSLPYIILLTSKTQNEYIVAGLEAGANDYITKPFNTSELKARIDVGIRVVDLQFSLNEKIITLENTQAEIRQLKKLIPICSYCKSIRDEKGQWHEIVSYISHRTNSRFSHGICPDCLKSHVKTELEAIKK